jgi:signal transduction histidine kinase/DNA-binding response OmpR family regulator
MSTAHADIPATLGDPQSPQVLRLLHVEDSPDDGELVAAELQRAGYQLVYHRVETRVALLNALAQQAWDVVIADFDLPHFSGLAALTMLQVAGLELPFLIVSGAIGEETAVAAMKAGAHDYIMKGNLARLVPAIERELREAGVRRQRRQAEEALREEARVSGALARVGRELVSSLDTPVLLERLCQVTAEVLACDLSHTLLWKPDDEAYVVAAGHGYLPEQWETIQLMKFPATVIAYRLGHLDADGLIELDPEHQQADPLVAAFFAAYGVTVGLYIPLQRGTEIIGYHVAAFRQRSEPFSPQQRRVARGIAQLASMALANAQLFESTERANKLKADFVATMSHELRTPLGIIMGFQDLLLDGHFGSLTADQTEALQHASKAATGLLGLVQSILDLSRLESGRAPLEIEIISLPELVEEVVREARLTRKNPQVEISSTVAEAARSLTTDRRKLRVVLKNLVDNAVKFTEQGRVTVAAAARDQGVELAVSDTGVGIDPALQDVIFEPFRQGEPFLTRQHDGVGLGLYIVRLLLELLGGTVAVESEAGRGSTFRVWMPATPPVHRS